MKMNLQTGRAVEVVIFHRRPDLEKNRPLDLNGDTLVDVFRKNNPGSYAEVKVDGNVFTGEAICHENDMFIKRKGSRLALSRALAASPLNKAERSELHKFIFNGYQR